jgi:hypothetical protein
MISSIIENRVKTESGYQIVLRLTEDEYFQVYDDISDKAAGEILANYLSYHGDDGRPTEIGIRRNQKDNTICITACLDYLGNSFTDQAYTPDALNTSRRIQE